MKIINVLIAMVMLFAVSSCSKSDDKNTENIPFDVKEGDTFSSTFSVGDKDVATYNVKAYNFGTTANPVLIFVKDSYNYQDEYQNVFVPLEKEDLEKFIILWAKMKDYDLFTSDGKVNAYASFKDYITSNSIDPGMFVNIVNASSAVSELKSICSIVDVATSECYQNNMPMNNTEVNSVVSYLYNSGVSAEVFDQFVSAYDNKPIAFVKALSAKGVTPAEFGNAMTKGTVYDIIKICKNLVSCVSCIVDLVNKETKCSFDQSSINVLNGNDLDPSHYNAASSYKSQDFSVKYNFSKCTYHVEAEYGNTHPSYAGKYVKSVFVNPTHASVSCGKLIGSVTYSNALNIGDTAEDPIAKVYCSVQLQYGDCCCCQYYLNHNFTVDGTNGYTLISYNSGR